MIPGIDPRSASTICRKVGVVLKLLSGRRIRNTRSTVIDPPVIPGTYAANPEQTTTMSSLPNQNQAGDFEKGRKENRHSPLGRAGWL